MVLDNPPRWYILRHLPCLEVDIIDGYRSIAFRVDCVVGVERWSCDWGQIKE